MYTKEQQKANRKLWVEALRSGKYKQVRGGLGNKDGHCCLGVLCEVMGVEKRLLHSGWFGYGEDVYSYTDILSPVMCEQVGLKDSVGHIQGTADSLASMNDEGKSFLEIADIIESEPSGLFKD